MTTTADAKGPTAEADLFYDRDLYRQLRAVDRELAALKSALQLAVELAPDQADAIRAQYTLTRNADPDEQLAFGGSE